MGSGTLPRTIWTVWHDWDAAPELAQRSLESWRSQNPGWDLRNLCDADLPDLLGPETAERILDGNLSRQHASDLLRNELLFRFGGVWADATTLCAQPLDDWLPQSMGAGYFAFHRPDEYRPMASWFQASVPAGEMISRLHSAFLAYWQDRAETDNYFWPHRIFALLRDHDPVFARLWDQVPDITAMHPFHFGPQAERLVKAPVPQDLAMRCAPPAPVYKLTHKLRETPKPGSLYDVLVQTCRKPAGPRSRRMVLHIGLPKAASTTIQSWADQNRDVLAERGIVYPPVDPRLQHPKHQELVLAILKPPRDVLDRVLYPHGGDTLFLSAEGLSVHLADADAAALAHLRDRLSAYDITLFINRRAPDSWLRSFHQQLTVNPPMPDFPYGTTMTIDEVRALPSVQLMMNPAELAERAMAAYGARDVVFGDLETDWAETLTALLGVPDLAPDLYRSARKNKGLSSDATELLRQMNGVSMSRPSRNLMLALLRQCDSDMKPQTAANPVSAARQEELSNALKSLRPATRRQSDLVVRCALRLDQFAESSR
ncbi:MAG: hypothetical protein KDA50_03230 [Rhodobacteraceae bacterium]|nr:hypothetical protein [Paracoccaceae bacterium]